MARALQLFQKINRYSAPTLFTKPMCEGNYRFMAGSCAVTMKTSLIYKVCGGIMGHDEDLPHVQGVCVGIMGHDEEEGE